MTGSTMQTGCLVTLKMASPIVAVGSVNCGCPKKLNNQISGARARAYLSLKATAEIIG